MAATRVKSLTLKLTDSGMDSVWSGLLPVRRSLRMKIRQRRGRITVKPPISIVFRNEADGKTTAVEMAWQNGHRLAIDYDQIRGMKYHSVTT